MQVDDGIFMMPLPEDDKDQRRGRDDGQPQNEVRFEPVIALTFVEDDLKGSEAERDETEAGVVDAGFAKLAALEVGRILDEARGEKQRNNSDWNIDKENPAPGEVVGNPTAERRADGRCHDNGDAIDGERHSPFGGCECIGQNSLLARLQSAAARALEDAEEDEHAEVGRESAEERTDGEDGDTAHVEMFAADNRREPTA